MSPQVVSAQQTSPPVNENNTNNTQSNAPKSSKPKPRISTQPKVASVNDQQKKHHRKPIMDWFQRKLGGTVKGKRAVDDGFAKGNGRVQGVQRTGSRVASSPMSSGAAPGGRHQPKLDAARTVSLNGDESTLQQARHSDEDEDDCGNSINESLAQDSVWSPNSLQEADEADEDASLRPLPPSSPPSPSPSRSSSSYLSDPRTFKSIAASTKPTTLLSIDLHGNGMAHIAQAPLTPNRYAHARSSSTATNPPLSVAPPSPQTSSRPESVQDPLNNVGPQPQTPNSSIVQAPLHTTHHPRNNPRPLSPPSDDASLLTLASSAYAIPGLRVAGTPGWSSPPSAIGGGGDSISHFGGTYADADAESASQMVDDERLDDRDADASLRALRPRSTRRGSWESEVSRWSARIQVTGPRERSLWTTNSRAGTFSTDNVDNNDPLDVMADSAIGEVNVEPEADIEAEKEQEENAAISSPQTDTEPRHEDASEAKEQESLDSKVTAGVDLPQPTLVGSDDATSPTSPPAIDRKVSDADTVDPEPIDQVEKADESSQLQISVKGDASAKEPSEEPTEGNNKREVTKHDQPQVKDVRSEEKVPEKRDAAPQDQTETTVPSDTS